MLPAIEKPFSPFQERAMRVTVICSIVVTLSLTACANHHPTDSASSPDRLSIRSTHENGLLPLNGDCAAAMAPPSVVSPGVIRQVDSGTCRITHLGQVEFYSDKVISVAAGTQVTQATFTAANGDSIYVTGSGTNTPSGNGLVAFVTNLTFVRGTGRFANVAGGATATGEANLTTRRSTLTLEGSISYQASDRSNQ